MNSSARETIATLLWHRFPPPRQIEWEYDTLRAEYLAAADEIIAALRSIDTNRNSQIEGS